MIVLGGGQRNGGTSWGALALALVATVCGCDEASPPPPEAMSSGPGGPPTAASQPAPSMPPPTPAAASGSLVGRPVENASATAKQTDFSVYWRELRPALLAANAESVARLTKFPFTVRGELDDDPVQAVERPAFPAVLRQLLARDVGLSPEPEPLSRYLVRLEALPPGAVAGTEARVASMQFTLGPDGWRFVGAYLGESE